MTSRLASLTRLPLILAALFTVAACSQEAPTPAAPAASAPATTAPAPASTAATESPAPSAPIGPIAPPSGPAPVAGSDYAEIPGGQPFQPGRGKIEVAEAFGYTCPHCASFEPQVSAWAARLPADVQFVPVAAPFGGYWMPYAKAYYTAQAMGLAEKTHDAMFRAIHVERSLPVQPLPTDTQIAQFYAKFGADPKQFESTMNSFAINAKLKRAQQFLMASGVDSTPMLVVNGKYRVMGKTFDDSLRIAEHLIAQERAERSGAAPSSDAEAPAGG
ncbi:MAG TPA: thiol:disulfide interchange protein DsbA/DsbL [Lysobacter sp.]|nr:thiol:disulfide interchange protein DsbA/DsbL [Lysobacter sp.]